jgi:predicted nucleotidyltransferase component of viral defense system
MRNPDEMRRAGTSICAKLRDTARATGQDSEFLHKKFAVERLVVRINESRFAGEYVMKGGMVMLTANPDMPRTTEDLDFTALSPFTKDSILAAFLDIAAVEPSQEDGMVFTLDEAKARKTVMMRDEGVNPGLRCYFDVAIHTQSRPSALRVKVDAAYGETISPEPVYGALSRSIRGWDPPVVPMYPWETVLAEKIHTIVRQGFENSRMRDFYDILAITRKLPLEGGKVMAALKATFENRAWVPLDASPAGLTQAFAAHHQAQWTSLMAKKGFKLKIASLADVVSEVAAYAHPLLAASVSGEAFGAAWVPGRGWDAVCPGAAMAA